MPSIDSPTGVAADASGNAYVVANTGLTPGQTPGVHGTITRYSSSGASTQLAPVATTFGPQEIVVDPSTRNIYMTDSLNSQILELAANSSPIAVFAGSSATGTADGTGTAASFNQPTGIATDACGNVYVADQGTGGRGQGMGGTGRVRRITPQSVVTTVYTAPGNTTPTTITLDSGGNIYVTTMSTLTNDSASNALAGVWELKPNA